MQALFQTTHVLENDEYNLADMAGRPPLHDAPPFGQRLATFRKARGLSQSQLAKLLGKTREAVDYYERRAKNPSADIVLKIAEVLEVSVNELLGTECKPTRKPGPPPKFQRLIEQVSDLPRNKQKFITELLESYLHNGHKQAA